MKKTFLVIITAAALCAAGCKPGGEKTAPLDPQYSFRNLCQTLLAESINKTGGMIPESESKKLTSECMTATEKHKTPQEEKAFVQRVLSSCKDKAGSGQAWLDCYKQETSQ